VSAQTASGQLLKRTVVFAALVLGAAGFLLFRDDVMALIRPGMELLRRASPAVFFTGMAILPALGAPLAFFLLTAAPVFEAHLGMPTVVALSLVSITANMSISHVLAARVLRPPLQYLMNKWGYRLPQVSSGDATDLIVLLRATPGVPFPVQNYLLGLAGMPFRRYLIVSCLITWPIGSVMILFGESLWRGSASKITVGLMLVVALVAAVHLVRKHIESRQGPADPAGRGSGPA